MPYERDTSRGGPGAFPPTRWSVVREAAGGKKPSRDALEAVIVLYWKPVYKYIRIHWRRSNDDAKDLVQGFFTVLLEQEILGGFDPAKGSFRGWLRSCVDHFVLKQQAYQSRSKRGGLAVQRLDFESAEWEISRAAAAETPEELFFREWQRQTFALALEDLRRHSEETGRALQYSIFAAYDLADQDRPRYADLAERHGVTEATVTNYIAWARRELRRRVLERLASVTSGAPELHGEARAIFGRR
jgi:RNA polymerase sigma-70 factor (ECF subfamily)